MKKTGTAVQQFGRKARAVVEHRDPQNAFLVCGRHCDGTGPFTYGLAGVQHQIEQHLPHGVTRQTAREADGDIVRQLDAVWNLIASQTQQFRYKGSNLNVLLRFRSAMRRHQELIEKPSHPRDLGGNELKAPALIWLAAVLQQIGEPHLNASERITQFVGDAGGHFSYGRQAIGLGECKPLPQQRFCGCAHPAFELRLIAFVGAQRIGKLFDELVVILHDGLEGRDDAGNGCGSQTLFANEPQELVEIAQWLGNPLPEHHEDQERGCREHQESCNRQAEFNACILVQRRDGSSACQALVIERALKARVRCCKRYRGISSILQRAGRGEQIGWSRRVSKSARSEQRAYLNLQCQKLC